MQITYMHITEVTFAPAAASNMYQVLSKMDFFEDWHLTGSPDTVCWHKQTTKGQNNHVGISWIL